MRGVPRTSPAAPLDPVEAAVLRLVLYFDVFHHPLRRAELHRFVDPGAPGRVDAAVEALGRRGLVALRGAWCHAPGRADGVARREERARNAERLWPVARAAAGVLARAPFVRGVLITGALSKGSATPDDDVDFLLLVEPGRIWTLKSLLQVLRKGGPERAAELLCTNYLLATDRPEIDDKNVFTAIELATAVPMAGAEACVSLLRHNDWARRFVPGLDWAVERARHAPPLPRSRPRQALEAALRSGDAVALEHRARRAWDRYWDRKYAFLDAPTRTQRFKRRQGVATNHLHDFQGYVLGELGRRLQAAGEEQVLELERCGRPIASPRGAG